MSVFIGHGEGASSRRIGVGGSETLASKPQSLTKTGGAQHRARDESEGREFSADLHHVVYSFGQLQLSCIPALRHAWRVTSQSKDG